MSGVSCEEHCETGDINKFLSSFSLRLACIFCVVASWNQSSLLGPTAEIAITVSLLNQGSNNRGICLHLEQFTFIGVEQCIFV